MLSLNIFSLSNMDAQRGQAGLVVLLMTVIALTVGISVASRTGSDVALSRQEEESNQAFNAAEAGVERGLAKDPTTFANQHTETFQVGETDVNLTVTKKQELESRLFKGVSVHIDVTGVTTGRQLVIDWGKENCTTLPASLLLTIFSSSGGRLKSRSIGYTPNCAGSPSNGLTKVLVTGTAPYNSRATVSLQTGDLFVRLKPLYKDTSIKIVAGGGWTLPTQYYKVSAVADNQRGSEVRAVEVNRTLPVAPSLFDFVLYSGTTLVKN